MSSDEGLDAYGAATWGQFFIYQGFNPHVGWMHTSSGVDNVDEFAEKVERRGNGYCYWYGTTCRPLGARPDHDPLPHGGRAARRAQLHHVDDASWADRPGRGNGRWIAFAMMNKPVEALQQSFLRTKATDLAVVHAHLGAEGEQLEQHRLRRRQGRNRRISRRSSCRGATIASTIPSRSTAAIRAPTGTGCTPISELPNTINPAERLGHSTATTGPTRRPGLIQPEARRISRPISTWPARTIARSTPRGC